MGEELRRRRTMLPNGHWALFPGRRKRRPHSLSARIDLLCPRGREGRVQKRGQLSTPVNHTPLLLSFLPSTVCCSSIVQEGHDAKKRRLQKKGVFGTILHGGGGWEGRQRGRFWLKAPSPRHPVPAQGRRRRRRHPDEEMGFLFGQTWELGLLIRMKLMHGCTCGFFLTTNGGLLL